MCGSRLATLDFEGKVYNIRSHFYRWSIKSIRRPSTAPNLQRPISSLATLEEDEVDSSEAKPGEGDVLLRPLVTAPPILSARQSFGDSEDLASGRGTTTRASRNSLKTFRRTSILVSTISRLSRRRSTQSCDKNREDLELRQGSSG